MRQKGREREREEQSVISWLIFMTLFTLWRRGSFMCYAQLISKLIFPFGIFFLIFYLRSSIFIASRGRQQLQRTAHSAHPPWLLKTINVKNCCSLSPYRGERNWTSRLPHSSLPFHWHANHVNYGRGNIISYRLNMISNDRLELELESPGTDPRRTTTRQRMYMAKI